MVFLWVPTHDLITLPFMSSDLLVAREEISLGDKKTNYLSFYDCGLRFFALFSLKHDILYTSLLYFKVLILLLLQTIQMCRLKAEWTLLWRIFLCPTAFGSGLEGYHCFSCKKERKGKVSAGEGMVKLTWRSLKGIQILLLVLCSEVGV